MTPERIKYLEALEKIRARKYQWEVDEDGIFTRIFGKKYYFSTGLGDEPQDTTQLMFCGEDDRIAIICPFCVSYRFVISYGEYECFANCQCGHKMSIYSG